MFVRIAITLQTIALLLQAVTAGLLLSSPGGRALHSVSAIAVVVTVLLHLVAAITTRQRNVILPAVGAVAMTIVQIALGIAHVKSLHVPLGVVMFGVSLLRFGQVWAERRTPVAVA
ncbi:hypothetical protein [Acrocarpospora catenulata]|uniref:hypothetical protein n=1 Tax=Acrocarpospora catenulata TaxID=2836182 RepID=UPI001BDB2E45|nr:hypothetical protein [Acrocarpospora catenulata]